MLIRHSTAGICKYFSFTKDDTLQTVSSLVSYRAVVSKGSTTNIHSNLQQNHRDLFETLQISTPTKSAIAKPDLNAQRSKTVQQASIPQSSASVTPDEKTSRHHKELTKAIARCLGKDMMPINSVSRRFL